MFRACCTLLLCLITNTSQADDIARQLQALRQQYAIGAVSWARVEGNQVVELGGLGQYGLQRPRAVTAHSLFRAGSLTKLLTALSLHMLADEGKLMLDAPLRHYLPEVPLHNPYPNAVTLRMVLEHSAGLHDLTQAEFNHPRALSLREAFNVAPDARQVMWPPGLHPSYSNVGAGYAGLALEAVTGQNWDSWIQERLLKPLNMHHSTTQHSPELMHQLVTGYDTDRTTAIPYWHTLFRPFGALNTSAQDFSQLLKLLINRGRYNGIQLIKTESLIQMEAPQSSHAAMLGHPYGYGAGLYRWYRNGRLLLGHGGDGDGYLAHFAYNPASKRGMFIVINAFHHPALRAMRKPLETWVIAPLEPVAPATATLTEAHYPHLLGHWQAVTQRFPERRHTPHSLVIERHNNHLQLRRGRSTTRLLPAGCQTPHSIQLRETGDGAASHLFLNTKASGTGKVIGAIIAAHQHSERL